MQALQLDSQIDIITVMFAVVAISGKQYTVAVGDVVEVNRIDGEVGDAIVFDQVYLVSDKNKTSVGTPLVKSMKVKAKIVGQVKGEKISVRRFKSKVRERKATGFRPQYTRLEIVAIG